MTAIVCVSQSWGIGRDGALLFRISADHKRFRTLTCLLYTSDAADE